MLVCIYIFHAQMRPRASGVPCRRQAAQDVAADSAMQFHLLDRSDAPGVTVRREEPFSRVGEGQG